MSHSIAVLLFTLIIAVMVLVSTAQLPVEETAEHPLRTILKGEIVKQCLALELETNATAFCLTRCNELLEKVPDSQLEAIQENFPNSLLQNIGEEEMASEKEEGTEDYSSNSLEGSSNRTNFFCPFGHFKTCGRAEEVKH
jgi:hypothetical protein